MHTSNHYNWAEMRGFFFSNFLKVATIKNSSKERFILCCILLMYKITEKPLGKQKLRKNIRKS